MTLTRLSTTDPIAALAAVAGTFGPEEAGVKARLLDEIAGLERAGARALCTLHDTLCFMRAYPDNPRVKRGVDALIARLRSWGNEDSAVLADTGFPGSVNRTDFSLPLVARLLERFPGCLEIDWDELEEQDALTNSLGLLVTSGECQGLDDITLELRDWFEAARPASALGDLAFLVALFEHAKLDAAARDLLFETCAVPIRFRLAAPGTARCEITRPVERMHWQRRAIDRKRRPLAGQIRRPSARARRVSRATGAGLIDLATRSLTARNLEIRTLVYANPRDVALFPCGRGLDVALIGVVPAYRDPLECHTCVLVTKNGVPIAYGPATVSLGCCEIGLNLFPEFRGSEIQFVYPQFMRAIHHVLGADYFFLTRYGMGEDNPAAIRTGAFWFYRKLGFVASNPTVEALAREEEARMRDDPTHRSSTAMLRRLSHTEAHLDLSGGTCRKLDLAAVGLRLSRWLNDRYGADRPRGEARCIEHAARILGETTPARRAWAMLAPILCLIPDLEDWSARDKQRLLRIVRAKGRPSEAGVDRMIRGHARFKRALYAIA